MKRRDFISLTAGAAALNAGCSQQPQSTGTAQGEPKPALMVLGCQSGPTSDERLSFFKRHAVDHVCGWPDRQPDSNHYTVEGLSKLRERCEKHSVSLDMVGAPFLSSSHIDRERRPNIMLGKDPERDRDIDDIIAGYWTRMLGMARSGLFEFVGHLDMYKKFGQRPSVDMSEHVNSVLDAIAKSGMAVELNTSGWYKTAGEQYPSQDMVIGCRKRRIPMLVTADAHHCSDLTRDFDRGTRLLRDAGYSEKAVFAGRKIGSASL